MGNENNSMNRWIDSAIKDIGKLQSNYSVHTVMLSTIFCWYNHGVQPWYNSPLISLPFPLHPSCTLIQTFCHVKETATYSKIIISWIFKLQMELFFFFTSRQCTGVWEKIEKLLSKSFFKKWMNKLNFFYLFKSWHRFLTRYIFYLKSNNY